MAAVAGSPEKESHCQYFVLSPEVEHREVRKVDENTDVNVVRTVVKISKVKGAKNPKGPVPKKVVTTAPVRPSTPTRGRPRVDAKTPAPLTARCPMTPKTEPRLVAPLTARTPGRTPKAPSPRAKCLEEDDMAVSVCSGHFSVYSDVSGHSRLTQLSRKSFSKHILSSKEIEEMEVMAKRRELTAMLRRNQLNVRKALHGTDLQRKQSTTKLTEPKEFHFSCPPTPRSPSPVSEREDTEGSKPNAFPRFLRSSSSRSLETWKPQLTVPQGPSLQVVRRLSAPRPTSCPPDEPVTPRRRRVEVHRAAAEAERRAAVREVPAARRPTQGKEDEKPLAKRVSESGPGTASPFQGGLYGGLTHSRSAKSIKAGSFGGRESDRSSMPLSRVARVSFGSKSPRPCCS